MWIPREEKERKKWLLNVNVHIFEINSIIQILERNLIKSRQNNMKSYMKYIILKFQRPHDKKRKLI